MSGRFGYQRSSRTHITNSVSRDQCMLCMEFGHYARTCPLSHPQKQDTKRYKSRSTRQHNSKRMEEFLIRKSIPFLSVPDQDLQAEMQGISTCQPPQSECNSPISQNVSKCMDNIAILAAQMTKLAGTVDKLAEYMQPCANKPTVNTCDLVSSKSASVQTESVDTSNTENASCQTDRISCAMEKSSQTDNSKLMCVSKSTQMIVPTLSVSTTQTDKLSTVSSGVQAMLPNPEILTLESKIEELQQDVLAKDQQRRNVVISFSEKVSECSALQQTISNFDAKMSCIETSVAEVTSFRHKITAALENDSLRFKIRPEPTQTLESVVHQLIDLSDGYNASANCMYTNFLKNLDSFSNKYLDLYFFQSILDFTHKHNIHTLEGLIDSGIEHLQMCEFNFFTLPQLSMLHYQKHPLQGNFQNKPNPGGWTTW